MKKLILFLSISIVITNSFAQVGINTSTPDASAMLDVTANNKGFLPPRLTTAERDAISNPAEGLQIYNTDSKCMEFYIGGNTWVNLCGQVQQLACGSFVAAIASSTDATCLGGNDGEATVTSSGGQAPFTFAWSGSPSTDSTASGLSAGTYGVTLTDNNGCTAAQSIIIADGSLTSPSAPTAGSHNGGASQIEWNWNSVSGADGYKYNTTNDYGTATDNSASTSYTQTGLSCGAAYTLYVWAYNVCANSIVTTLTQTTSSCGWMTCGDDIPFTYNGSQVTYGTVSNNGECWLDRNLGASQAATSSSDANAYGDYFQWGRLDDGHQVSSSGTTSTPSGNDVPGHSNFITYNSSPYDWRSPQNDNLWQGVSGTNNPCPSGWRVATDNEWDTERASWSSNDAAGAFGSPLKLPLPGVRDKASGAIGGDGSAAIYSSSTVDGSQFKRLEFTSSSAAINSGYRSYGFSLRCIKG